MPNKGYQRTFYDDFIYEHGQLGGTPPPKSTKYLLYPFDQFISRFHPFPSVSHVSLPILNENEIQVLQRIQHLQALLNLTGLHMKHTSPFAVVRIR